MIVTKRIDLPLLQQELEAAGVPVNGLGTTVDADGATHLHTYDTEGYPTELPPEANPVVDAHVAPPLVTEFVGEQVVSALVRTTDAVPLEVFRFPCEQRRLYEATLTIRGIDAGNFAVKRMVGEFVWKRITGNAIVTGLTVVSDIHDTAAASWLPNYAPVGAAIVFTVQGAAARTIDWFLDGSVQVYAPGGLA